VNSAGDLRRNLVLQGVPAAELLEAVGRVIQMGDDCKVLVHRHCVPCLYNERKNSCKGLMETIWKESGVSCQVLLGGSIHVGDAVKILMDETMPVDPGNQPPGYYVPPSQRTTAMWVGTLRMMRDQKKKLLEIDPRGVERADASYGTVGLTFWPRDKQES